MAAAAAEADGAECRTPPAGRPCHRTGHVRLLALGEGAAPLPSGSQASKTRGSGYSSGDNQARVTIKRAGGERARPGEVATQAVSWAGVAGGAAGRYNLFSVFLGTERSSKLELYNLVGGHFQNVCRLRASG